MSIKESPGVSGTEELSLLILNSEDGNEKLIASCVRKIAYAIGQVPNYSHAHEIIRCSLFAYTFLQEDFKAEKDQYDFEIILSDEMDGIVGTLEDLSRTIDTTLVEGSLTSLIVLWAFLWDETDPDVAKNQTRDVFLCNLDWLYCVEEALWERFTFHVDPPSLSLFSGRDRPFLEASYPYRRKRKRSLKEILKTLFE